MIFDSHAHLISEDTVRYPIDPLSGALAPGDMNDPVTAERLLHLMDDNDVEQALVVQRAHIYGFDNSYVVDSAAKYPDRLTAMCMVNALERDAPEKVRHWVSERGAIAVRLMEPHRGAGPEWFASEQAQETWYTVKELGVSMRVHFFGWNRDYCLPVLFPLLEKFSSISVVLDHLTSPVPEAGPDGIDELMRKLAGYANVSLLYSTINHLRLASTGQSAPAVLRRVIDVFGSERLMWGSDVAQSKGSYEKMVGYATEAVAGLDESESRDILYETGKHLYSRK